MCVCLYIKIERGYIFCKKNSIKCIWLKKNGILNSKI